MRNTRRVALVALTLALVGLTPLLSQVDTVEVEKATRTILCDCGCHPQSVHSCACGRAAEMREDMTRLVASGMSGEEVVAKYVAEFGEQIRVAPTADGFNLIAWVGPFVALLFGGGLVVFALRRWSRNESPDVPSKVEIPTEDDVYVRRLQDQLRELE